MLGLIVAAAATILFPATVYYSESRSGQWRPRGGNGKFISHRTAYLRYIPVFAIFWFFAIQGAR